METISHISGKPFHIGGRVIQRCVVCGAKLADSATDRMEVVGEDLPHFMVWPSMRFVQGEIADETVYRLLPEAEVLPDDLCLEFA